MTQDSNRILHPLEYFTQSEKAIPNTNYLVQPWAGQIYTYTWKEVGIEARRMANAIKAKNYPPGSKIAMISKNCAHWIIADLAIMMAGHVSVPIYPNVSAETMKYVITHSDSVMLFIGKLDDWKSQEAGIPDGVDSVSFPLYGPEGFTKWHDLVNENEPISEFANLDVDTLMTLIYTSGTTGTPKGVMLNFSALSYAINNALSFLELGPADNRRLFSYLPLSHIAERMLIEMGSLRGGATVYFAESLDTFVADLAAAKPSVFLGVPRIWTKFQMGVLEKLPQKKLNFLLKIPIVSGLIKAKIRKGLGLNDANHYLTGAAPTPPALMKWYQTLGIQLQEVYGMTENSAYSHFNDKNDFRFGFAGKPMPNVDVRISEEGEIQVKSAANMVGYYKEEELTKDAFTEDHYLKTGDKGEVHDNGWLKITGRVKDIFKTAKGKYISPAPIELKFAKNSSIEQILVAGTGLPQPICLVVLSESASEQDKSDIAESLKETMDSINPTLGSHEKIKKMIVVKEAWTIENGCSTPTLKIKRGPVEAKYSKNFEKWYDESDAVIWE